MPVRESSHTIISAVSWLLEQFGATPASRIRAVYSGHPLRDGLQGNQYFWQPQFGRVSPEEIVAQCVVAVLAARAPSQMKAAATNSKSAISKSAVQ